MAEVKIISFCDSADKVLNREFMSDRYNLTLVPTVCRCGNSFFLDMLEPDLSKYSLMANKTEPPFVSTRILSKMIERAYKLGYGAVVVICPHSSVTSHRRDVINSRRCIKRRERGGSFRVEILDTKSAGAGMLIPAIYLSKKAADCIDEDLIIELSRRVMKSAEMYCISKSDDLTNIYHVHGNSTEKIDVSPYRYELQREAFLCFVAEKINASKHKAYALSIGSNVSERFLSMLLFELEEKVNRKPLYIMPYSTIGTYMFGDNALCVHIFDSDDFDFDYLKELINDIKSIS